MRQRNDSGATAVEFAIILPVALALILMTVYVGVYYFYCAAAAHVARAVARDASIPSHNIYPSAGDESVVATHAAGGLLPTPTSIQLSGNPSVGEGNELTVTVTYELPGVTELGRWLPFVPHTTGHLVRTVTVRYE